MKKILIVLMLLISPLLIAQNFEETTSLNPSLTSYNPPSPDASALMKFVDTPVGEATGIPKINIPIYNFSDAVAGTNVNISLDYHAGGIRVAEVTSRIGIGWALNAGGIITRTRMGIQDEIPGFGFWDFSIPEETEGNSPRDIEFRPFNRMYANVADSQPDIFTYNFPGGSGKFLIGKNNDFIDLGQNNIKVTYNLSYNVNYVDGRAISSFNLKDDNGIEYFFEEIESTQNFPIDVNDSYVSSWYLTKIISPEKPEDTIQFHYEIEFLDNYNTSYNHQMYRQFGDFAGQEIVNSSSSSQTINSKRIKSIEFPNMVQVNFQYAQAGQARGGNALEEIIISDGNKSRSFNLYNDYSLNRRTLKEVAIYGGENSGGKYQFEYIGSLPDSYSIPDHWGFNRGGATSRIPREIFEGGLGNTGVKELPGSNRDTDSVYVKSGSLRKIIYPTGGYTLFDMEANTSNDARLDKEFTVVQDGPGAEQKSEVSTVDSNSNYGDDVVNITYNGDAQQATNFEIIVGEGELNCTNCKVIASLFSDTNYYAPPLAQVEIPILDYGSTGTFSVLNLIPGHTYKLLLQVQNISDFYSYVTVNWEERKENISNTRTYTHKQDFVGGLRVKRILSFDGVNSQPVLVKEYQYTLEDGITSSGTLGAFPLYSQAVFYENRYSIPNEDGEGTGYQPPNPGPENYQDLAANVIIRSSSSIFDLPSYLGSPVIYKRVVISQKGSGGESNGKEIKYFTNFEESPTLVDNYFPYTPTVTDSWNYGLLQKHQIYNSQNSKVKEIENTYLYSQDRYFQDSISLSNFKSVTIAPVIFYTGTNVPLSTDLPPLGMPVYFRSDYFYPSAGRSDLLQQTTKTLLNGNWLSTSKSYTYDDQFFKPQTIVTQTSTGEEIIKELDYAYELLGFEDDPSGFHQKLFNMHNLNEVIEERSKIVKLSTVELLSLSRKNYTNWGINNLKIQNVSTKKGDGNLEARINYHSYDSKGNPQEISLVNGPHIIYLWGYNKSFPIAKIENSTISEIVGELGDVTQIDESDISLINSLRTSLVKAQITTYTYKPLVGVTSITDPRGEVTTFHYDDFNRLEFVKDEDGNILKEHKYQYKIIP